MSNRDDRGAGEPQLGSVAWMHWRLDRNDDLLRQFAAELGNSRANPFGLPDVVLEASPGLVRPGEAVCIRLSARGNAPPSGAAFVQADYLSRTPGSPEPLWPRWTRSGPDAWVATHEIRPRRAGTWRVSWDADRERLTRVFAVAVPGRPVVTLWVGSNVPPIDDEIHRHDLPGDVWVGDHWSPFDRTLPTILQDLGQVARGRFRHGDRAVPFVNAGWILPGIRDMNLMHLPDDVQRRGYTQARELWGLLGLGPMDLFASYTPGHSTPRILEDLGVRGLTSLCVWQNVRDGDNDDAWLINHMGAPNAPYFVARDDFRRVEGAPVQSDSGDPGRPRILGFSMGTTSDVRCYDWFCYDGCATNTMSSQRYTGNTAVSANVHRFSLVVDGWIHDAANNPDLLFVTAALENFHRSAHWREANRQAVDYLVRRASEEKVVFASAADVADFYRRHYRRQPENLHLWRDCYAGLRYEDKPACLPDRLEISNDRFHSLHNEGEPLPLFLWDFTSPWSSPEWEAQVEIRNRYGMVHPLSIAATVNPLGSCPRQADLRGVTASVSVEPVAGGVCARAVVETPRSVVSLPIAVWGLPLERDAVLSVQLEQGHGRARLLPVRDGWSGNLHAVLVLDDLDAGRTVATLTATGRRRNPHSQRFDIHGTISARTFVTSEGTRTYLWRSDGEGSALLRATVPPGSSVELTLNDGRIVEPDADGVIVVPIGDSWREESPCLRALGDTSASGWIAWGPIVPRAQTPFLRAWEVSELLPTLAEVATWQEPPPWGERRDTLQASAAGLLDLGDLFRNAGADRCRLLRCRLFCEEAMRLEALFGYNGPLQAWVDGVEIAHDPHGPRRAVPDSLGSAFDVAAGRHELTVALGARDGNAAGLCLRFERLDLGWDRLSEVPPSYRLPQLGSAGPV